MRKVILGVALAALFTSLGHTEQIPTTCYTITNGQVQLTPGYVGDLTTKTACHQFTPADLHAMEQAEQKRDGVRK